MHPLSRRFPHRRAFITGAGSGLGQALALMLARDGWSLALNDARAEALDETAAAVERAGGHAHAFVFDVAERAPWAEAVDETVRRLGGIDLVVNNAGVAGGGLMGEFDAADWEWMHRINVLGVAYGCHYWVPQLRRQRSGHILNVASAAALVPVSAMAAYCSGKAAVKMLSEVLYNELHADEVGVTVLMPEFFRTALADRTRGPEQDTARRLITTSRYSAEDVARYALDEVEKRHLHAPFPRHRIGSVWSMLRLAPQRALDLVRVSERRALGVAQVRR